MTARLLTILALALPLVACAAQPSAGAAAAGAAAGNGAAPAGQQGAVAAPSDSVSPSASPSHAAARSAASSTAPSASSAVPPVASTLASPAAASGATHAARVAPPAQPVDAGASTRPASAPSASAPAAAGTAPSDTAPAAAAEFPAAPAAPASGVTAPNPTAPGTVAPAPVTMPSGSATGSLLQTLLALMLVLAVLGGLAWFLKRYGPKAGGANANVRMVGSLNLGGRERVLVVEVGNQWIVLGASPGRINALATMPRQEGVEGSAVLAPHAPGAHSFADWLKQTIDKRK
jgi:flagellar protein FliO/FliZ